MNARTDSSRSGTPQTRETPHLLWRAARLTLFVGVASCSWFTDFKEQPKIDPWDARRDSSPPRGNPQGSVPIYGSIAPEFAYARTTQALEQMSGLTNPNAVDQQSVDRGQKLFWVNCSVCHGALGMGNGPVLKYGVFPPSIGAGSPAATQRTDGYIFAVIRNGKNLMPSYNRIEDAERWDIVNYLRAIQGRTGLKADSAHGRPGVTGEEVPGASVTAPTRPAPYYNQLGSQAGAREGLIGSTSAGAMPGALPPGARNADTTRPPAAAPAHRPPAPEGHR